MVRRLGISEKLTLAVPLLPDGENFKGTRPWERYRHLKRLRNDLVHVKQRGYDPDGAPLSRCMDTSTQRVAAALSRMQKRDGLRLLALF